MLLLELFLVSWSVDVIVVLAPGSRKRRVFGTMPTSNTRFLPTFTKRPPWFLLLGVLPTLERGHTSWLGTTIDSIVSAATQHEPRTDEHNTESNLVCTRLRDVGLERDMRSTSFFHVDFFLVKINDGVSCFLNHDLWISRGVLVLPSLSRERERVTLPLIAPPPECTRPPCLSSSIPGRGIGDGRGGFCRVEMAVPRPASPRPDENLFREVRCTDRPICRFRTESSRHFVQRRTR